MLRPKLVVGFAAETSNLDKNSKKLDEKIVTGLLRMMYQIKK